MHLSSSKITTSVLEPDDPMKNVGEILPIHEQIASKFLGEIFLHDPWFDYFFGDVNHNQMSAVVWFFNQVVQYGISYGRIWGFTENSFSNSTSNSISSASSIPGKNLLGCAVWQPPQDAGISFSRMLSTGFYMAPFSFGFTASIKALSSMQFLETCRNDVLKNEPHWYLFTIGIGALHRNQGKGTKLLSPILKMADAGNIKCYTDSASPRSVNFFRRNGFTLIKEIEASGSRPKVYLLLRFPNPGISGGTNTTTTTQSSIQTTTVTTTSNS